MLIFLEYCAVMVILINGFIWVIGRTGKLKTTDQVKLELDLMEKMK